MKVAWLGTEDTIRHNRQFDSLRHYMRDTYGVTLIGPGYTYDYRVKTKLSTVLPEDPDIFVWDDRGCSPLLVQIDRQPECPCIYIEQDYHQRSRWSIPKKLPAKYIFGSAPRPLPPDGLNPWTHQAGKMHPEFDPWIGHETFRMLPYCINTNVFHNGNGQRDYDGGMFGTITAWYTARREVKQLLKHRDGCWVGAKKHSKQALYWNDLADRLRQTKVLWVDGSNRGMFFLKFHEGISCGCLLIGKRPYGWDDLYPHEFMVDCEPEDAVDAINEWSAKDEEREEITHAASDWCRTHHDISVRGDAMWEVLCA